MTVYIAPFAFNFNELLIEVDSGTTAVYCDQLYDAIKLAQASEEGIQYERIARGSGLETLGPGVAVGLTVVFLSDWQIKFAPGNYQVTIGGGNLVGGRGGMPAAYTPGVTVVIILSASATMVLVDGSGGSAADVATAVWDHSLAAHDGNNTAGKILKTAGQNSALIPGLY